MRRDGSAYPHIVNANKLIQKFRSARQRFPKKAVMALGVSYWILSLTRCWYIMYVVRVDSVSRQAQHWRSCDDTRKRRHEEAQAIQLHYGRTQESHGRDEQHDMYQPKGMDCTRDTL